MNEIQIAIEGYNKEKYEIQKELLNRAAYAGDGKYNCFHERLKQIDTNIERLLALEHYPKNNN